MYAILASVAIMATSAVVAQTGSAIVVNACQYPVYLFDVPAANGGFSEIDKVLQPTDTFTQQWTELSNGDGWSIKLSPSTNLDNILQYEYTFHDDGTIWYDLSAVNGNPWDANWEITANSPSGTCSPKQQAYRYATDDAYGMQACPDDSTITVTLCSGEDNGGSSSASSSVAAPSPTTATSISVYSSPSSVAPVTSTAPETSSVVSVASTTPVASPTPASSTPASSATSTAKYTWRSHSWHQANAAATTLATSTVATSTTTTAPDGATVVDVETAVVTEIVTAYAKRHVHARHPHHAAA